MFNPNWVPKYERVAPKFDECGRRQCGECGKVHPIKYELCECCQVVHDAWSEHCRRDPPNWSQYSENRVSPSWSDMPKTPDV